MSEPQTTPTWEAEMLRLHRSHAWRHGWREFAACMIVAGLLAWGLV